MFLIFMTALTGCGVDRAQVRLCEQVVRALEGEAATLEMARAVRHPEVADAIVLDYQVRDAAGEPVTRWIACRFAGALPATRPQDLIGVITDRQGALPPVRVAMLQVWLRLADDGRASPPGARSPGLRSPPHHPAHLIQHLIDAIPLGSIYVLMAAGFSLVCGVAGRSSLGGGGALATVAVCAATLGVSFLVVASADGAVMAVAMALLVLVAAGGIYRWTVPRAVSSSQRGALGSAFGRQLGVEWALVATLAAAVLTREALRLAETARDLWLEAAAGGSHAVIDSDGFLVVMNPAQLVALAIAIGVVGVLGVVMAESGFGGCYRACRDSGGISALPTVDANRLVIRALLIGGFSVCIAGAITTLYYGALSAAALGLIVFKGLVAAAIGGFGSLGGAVVGGVAIAVFEILWAVYLSHDGRNLAPLGLLAVLLLLRPCGLLARRRYRFR